MLSINHLNITFNDKIIFKDAHFSAQKGMLTIIRGKSGIGKSTFLRALIFQYPCLYQYDGTDLSHLDKSQQQQFIYEKISFVNQVPQFLDGMKIIEHIQQYEKIGYQRNKYLEKSLGIDTMETKLPRNLSGGERIRAALYLAFMKQPEILILDEPTASLDVDYTNQVIHLLKTYAHDNHIVIVASHDHLMIDSGECIYDVKDFQLICDKTFIDDKKQSQLFKDKNKAYKKFSLHFGYKGFRRVMLCLVSMTLLILIYSSHLFQVFHNEYQNRLNTLSSLEFIVYKEKYPNDYYTFDGMEFPFTTSEINKIKNVDNITDINIHIDLNTNNLTMYDEFHDGISEESLKNISLIDQNHTLVDHLQLDYISMHNYIDNENIQRQLSQQFQNEGIIISDGLYKELLNHSSIEEWENPILEFNLMIPHYDSTNIAGMIIDEDSYTEISLNHINCSIRKVSLPIRGVLKEDETLQHISSLGNSLFIENDQYIQYIKDDYPEKERTVYCLNIGEGLLVYNQIPEEYLNYDILQQITESPWMPNCLLVKVDHISHMEEVVQDIKTLGFKVYSEYIDFDSIALLNSENESILLSFFISIIIIIYVFYIYLKYLMMNEEENARNYLSSIGFDFKEIQYIITKNYLKNFIALSLATSIILYLLIELFAKIQMIELIMPPRKEYFIFIFFMAFILEVILPLVLRKVKQ